VTHLSVGEHPAEPEYVGPCAACAGERARQSVHDHAFDMKHDESIPVSVRCEFEDRFGDVFVQIGNWAAGVAREEAEAQDNDPCEMHAPEAGDEL
jgi:hypothetical protein